MKNITNPDQNSLLLEDLIIWTNYEIEVAAYNGAGRGTYSHKVTEWTLQGGKGYTKALYHIYCIFPRKPTSIPSSQVKSVYEFQHFSCSLDALSTRWLYLVLQIPLITSGLIVLVPWIMLSLWHKT